MGTAPAPDPSDALKTVNPWWLRPLPLSSILARLIVVGAIVGVLGEIGARVDDKLRFGTAFNATPNINGDLTIQDSLGLRGRPNGHFEDRRLNSAGFRSPESTLTATSGCVRVMTLGASETFGYEEPPGQEYPAQLADSLSKRGCYQVVNAAIVGLAVPAMTQLYELWGSRFSPDLVVIMANPLNYLGDQAPHPPEIVAGGPVGTDRPWRPRLPSKVQSFAQYPAFIQHRRIERLVEQLVAGRPDDWFFRDMPTERLTQFRNDVDSLVTNVVARGATPVLLVHPLRYRNLSEADAWSQMQAMRQFSPRALPEMLLRVDSAGGAIVRDIATRRGVPVVDLPQKMNGHHDFFADPVHYSPAGSSVVAGALAAAIDEWRAANPRP